MHHVCKVPVYIPDHALRVILVDLPGWAWHGRILTDVLPLSITNVLDITERMIHMFLSLYMHGGAPSAM